VAGLRTKLAALALITGLLAAAGGSLFAQDTHPACAAKQHDCGKATRISECCCGDPGAARDAGAPARSRTELSRDTSVALTLPQFVRSVQPAPLSSAVQTSPPRLCLLDLPTLFATLLI
jgi:hypothetical protein